MGRPINLQKLQGLGIIGKIPQDSLDCPTDITHVGCQRFVGYWAVDFSDGGALMWSCIRFLAVASFLMCFAGLSQAQTLNGTPLLLSRTQSNNNWLVDVAKIFNIMGGSDTQPKPMPLAQGVNALGNPYQGPIAAPMNVRGSSGKLADYFFTPKTNLIQNQTVVGRSNFPTQAQLPGRMYLNNFGYTKFYR